MRPKTIGHGNAKINLKRDPERLRSRLIQDIEELEKEIRSVTYLIESAKVTLATNTSQGIAEAVFDLEAAKRRLEVRVLGLTPNNFGRMGGKKTRMGERLCLISEIKAGIIRLG